MTTSSKAVAGGVAANLIIVACWLLTLIPGWETVPFEPKAAIISLVVTAIGSGIVYFAPANRQIEP
jgi:hypothetical protein